MQGTSLSVIWNHQNTRTRFLSGWKLYDVHKITRLGDVSWWSHNVMCDSWQRSLQVLWGEKRTFYPRKHPGQLPVFGQTPFSQDKVSRGARNTLATFQWKKIIIEMDNINFWSGSRKHVQKFSSHWWFWEVLRKEDDLMHPHFILQGASVNAIT